MLSWSKAVRSRVCWKGEKHIFQFQFVSNDEVWNDETRFKKLKNIGSKDTQLASDG